MSKIPKNCKCIFQFESPNYITLGGAILRISEQKKNSLIASNSLTVKDQISELMLCFIESIILNNLIILLLIFFGLNKVSDNFFEK